MFVDLSTQIWALIKIWANLSTQTWALVTLLPKSEQLKPGFFLTREKKLSRVKTKKDPVKKSSCELPWKYPYVELLDTLAVLDWKSYFRWGDIKLRTREKIQKCPWKIKVVWKILNLWTYKQIIARRKNIQNVKTSFHRHFSFSRKKSNAA